MKRGPPSSTISTSQLIAGRERGKNWAREIRKITGKKMSTVKVTALVI